MADATIPPTTARVNRDGTEDRRSGGCTLQASIALGLLTYTGKRVCPKCGTRDRYTKSHNCVVCAKERVKRRTQEGYFRDLHARKRGGPDDLRSKGCTRQEAKALGHVHYLGRGPCPRCGTRKRYTSSNGCVECQKERQKHRPRTGYQRAYYAENRDKVSARKRAWKEQNRERVNAQEREWRRKNPEKCSATRRSSDARRRACVEAGISGPDLERWLSEQKKVCYWCGARCPKQFHVDHYTPLSKGGKHEECNLVIACQSCNLRKSARDPYEFAAQVGRLF